MQFSSQQIKGGINALICFGFLVILFTILQHSSDSAISLFTALPAATIITNGILAYHILYKKVKLTFNYWLALTIISSILWYIIAFVTTFIASTGVVVGMFVVVGAIFYLLKKVSLLVASLIGVFILVVVLALFAMGFEENYCVDKGYKADPTGNKTVQASADDVRVIGDAPFVFHEGDQIGISLREHFRCHTTFTFKDAFIKSLLPK